MILIAKGPSHGLLGFLQMIIILLRELARVLGFSGYALLVTKLQAQEHNDLREKNGVSETLECGFEPPKNLLEADQEDTAGQKAILLFLRLPHHLKKKKKVAGGGERCCGKQKGAGRCERIKNLGLCLGKGDAIQITAHSFLLEAFHLHCKCLPLICVIITAFSLQCPFVFFLTLQTIPIFHGCFIFSSKPFFSSITALFNVSLLLQHNCLFCHLPF